MFEIKRAKSNDLDTVAELMSEFLGDFNRISQASFHTDIQHLKEVASQLINRENYRIYLALDAHKTPVGLISISGAFAIYNGGDYGVINELYVQPNLRSRGIGKALLKAVYEFAENMNWEKIELGAPNEEKWPRTISFYEREGFKKVGPKLRIDL